MDELEEFCRRVLASEPAARAAAGAARQRVGDDNLLELLAAASSACREVGANGLESDASTQPASERTLEGTAAEGRAIRDQPQGELSVPGADGPASLAVAVAAELAAANRTLTPVDRELLALAELHRLSHDEIATVTGLAPDRIALGLAHARLALRAALRGTAPTGEGACTEDKRALRALARRQDGEPQPAEEAEWALAHLGACTACDRAHSAMLEAAACYRGWRVAPGVPAP